MKKNNAVLVRPNEVELASRIHEDLSYRGPGVQLVTLELSHQTQTERIPLPRHSGGFGGLVDLSTAIRWRRFDAEPPILTPGNAYLNFCDRGLQLSQHPPRGEAPVMVFNRSKRRLSIELEVDLVGVSLSQDLITLNSGEVTTVILSAQEAPSGSGFLHLKSHFGHQRVPVIVNNSELRHRARFTVTPNDLGAFGPDTQVPVEMSVALPEGCPRLEGLIRVECHPKPYFFPFELSQEQPEFRQQLNVSIAELPPVERGKLRICLLLDSELITERLTDYRLSFTRVVLERSSSVVRLGQSGSTARLQIWRSDGQQVELEIFLPEQLEDSLEVEAEPGGTFFFRLSDHCGLEGLFFLKVIDQSNGLSSQLPLEIGVQ